MIIKSEFRPDFSDFLKLKVFEKNLVKSYPKNIFYLGEVAMEAHQANLARGVFLMPTSIVWRKKIDGLSIFDCSCISEDRKKVFRIAVGQAEKKGIKVEVEFPLTKESFVRFKAFYDEYMKAMNYECILTDDYFNSATKRAIVNLYSADGEYLGGRLLSVFEKKVTADFRAVKRENVIKEGYDTLCEKAFYEFAAEQGRQYVTLGSELNLRGVGERKLGLVLNKIKYGYSPYILNFTPRMYADLNFLQNMTFDLVFFISLDNSQQIKYRREEHLQINFIVSSAENIQECLETINKISEKLSTYKVNLLDQNFNPLVLENVFVPK